MFKEKVKKLRDELVFDSERSIKEYKLYGDEWERGYTDSHEEIIGLLDELIFYCDTYEK
jgi:hypothetical protein